MVLKGYLVISSTWANNTLSDIATGLSTCVLKDGTQVATSTVPFAFGVALASGTTLKTYIENTGFSPLLVANGTTTGIVDNGSSGVYTKIGRQVFGDEGIGITSIGSGTGALSIKNGLPVVPNASLLNANFPVYFSHASSSFMSMLAVADGVNGTSNISLYGLKTANTGYSTVLLSGISNTFTLYVAFNYRASS